MRIFLGSFLCLVGLGLISCSRQDTGRRDREAARQAGREAYRASKNVKKGAKEAAHELHNAAKEFREGWEEARHEDQDKHHK